MTYRAWELKNLDRAALRELTAAIAEQAAEELEYNAQEGEPWSEQKYKAVLAAQQKENALLAGVLTARGVTDPTDALTLLAGEEELSDPFLLTDMQKACERIWRAIDDGETIVVFGDYDVDGVTATALLYQHLKGMGATVKCMLPSREGDGYGLSKNAIRSIHDKGCQLIVTVDNGISAVDEADYAAEMGIDLIITDHHLPPTYQLTVQTERLMNVTLCGPKNAMASLTPEQVVIEIDAEDFSVATGEQNIACRLYVPSNGKIFALGSYVLQCRIDSN